MTSKKLCQRCKKNKATIDYAEGTMAVAHGFVEHICQECFDKMQKATPLYKKAYKKGQKDLYDHYFKNFKNPMIIERNDKILKELNGEIEQKLRANIIREMRQKHPKGFCYICGKMSATNHHLRDDKMGRKKRGKVMGIIPLCRECHDAIESMKKFKKLKKAFNGGREQAFKDVERVIKDFDFIKFIFNSSKELRKWSPGIPQVRANKIREELKKELEKVK